MKTAAKVFIIISMVFSFWVIIPLIVGILALNRLKTASTKDDLIGVGICTLLFCSVIGGILLLCMTDNDLQK